MDRRAQTATEYLVILAVVIVIALIVVGVLGGFGSIGGTSSRRSEDIWWQQADIAIVEHIFGNEIDAYLKLRNNLPTAVRLSNVYIDNFQFYGTDVILNPGDTLIIDSSNIVTPIPCPGLGEPYSFDILIEYTHVSTGAQWNIEHPLTGMCTT